MDARSGIFDDVYSIPTKRINRVISTSLPSTRCCRSAQGGWSSFSDANDYALVKHLIKLLSATFFFNYLQRRLTGSSVMKNNLHS